jgi:hypothetical protein
MVPSGAIDGIGINDDRGIKVGKIVHASIGVKVPVDGGED